MKKIATIITALLIAAAGFVGLGFVIKQIFLDFPNTIIEFIGCAIALVFPGMFIYVTLAGLVEYLKD